MTAALKNDPAQDFAVPAGITNASVCLADGGLANPWDAAYSEVFPSDNVPTKRCASMPKPAPKPEEDKDKKDKKDGEPTDPTPILLPSLPPVIEGLRRKIPAMPAT
jgi:hypothetical protein